MDGNECIQSRYCSVPVYVGVQVWANLFDEKADSLKKTVTCTIEDGDPIMHTIFSNTNFQSAKKTNPFRNKGGITIMASWT